MRNHSIIQTKKESYLSGATQNLHRHEPIHGKNRQTSLEQGLWIYVTEEEHRWLHDTEEGIVTGKQIGRAHV